MAFGTRVIFEAIRLVAFGGVGAAYAAVGSATTHRIRRVRLVNTTNQDIYVSIDGVVDHIRLATGTSQEIDMSTNKIRDDGYFLPKGTIFYVKHAGVAPGSGSVWIEAMCASGGI